MLTTAVLLALVLSLYCVQKKPMPGLLFSVVVAFVLMCIAGALEDAVAFCLAPTVPVLTLLRASSFRTDTEEAWNAKRLARWTLWSILIILLMVCTLLVFGPMAMSGFIVLLLWLGSMISYGKTARWSTSVCILSTLGSCIRQNLPLPMALECAAANRRDLVGFTFKQIKEWLVQGYSLVEAIQYGYPKCPSHALGVLIAAEKSNRLAEGFENALENIRMKAKHREMLIPVHPLYPFVVFALVCFVATAMFTFVIPQFASIIKEMISGELPYLTQLLLDFQRTWGSVALILISIGVCVYLLVRIKRWFWPRQYNRTDPVAWCGDWLRWHTPLLHWYEYNFALIQTVETLRMSLKAGSTVDRAIGSCLHLELNICYRRRIEQWLDRVQCGEDVSKSARKARLGKTLAWAFDTRVNQGNTLNVLEMLESLYRNNYSYYVTLAKFIMAPTITVLLAAFVGFIVLAIFLPAVSVITAMAAMYP